MNTELLDGRTGHVGQRKASRVTFLGHFGLGNLGNESTLQAMLFHLRRALPDADFRCICTGPEGTAAIHNIETVPVSRTVVEAWRSHSRVARVVRSFLIGVPSELYRWFDALKTLRGTDVLIVPGTGVLTDAFGLRGWGPYSTFKWSVAAKVCRCKLLFVSVGVGPLYHRLSRFLVKFALALADFRSYRDAASKQYLKGIGFERAADRVYPDLAFSLPETLFPRNDRQRKARRVVGLGLMEYAGRYSVEQPNTETNRNYLDTLVFFVQWLIAGDYDVRLLIGDFADLPVIREFKHLLEERSGVYDRSRIIDEPITSVEQLLSQLTRTDIVVATRFHNVLLALLNNKPVVAISFHHKCWSLMSAMGLSEYCLDINDLRADDLIAKMRGVEENTDSLKSLIREREGAFRAALDEQYELISKYT